MTAETALITGASAGIGWELARQFAAEKSNLVLVARRRERLEELAAEMREQHGVEAHAMVADLGQADAPRTIVDRLTRDGLTIDVLVNNAGFGALGPVAELDADRQMEMIQVNVVALTHLTRLLLPAMIQRRRGGILNVASTAGFQAGPFMAVYYASKAYVISFSEALADELALSGVAVSCLCPGPTLTEFAETAKMGNALMFKLQPMTAQQVARAGYRGFRRGKLLVVPGWMNYLGSMSVRFAPRSVARGIAKRLQWDK
jgi:short-subunit dehydrogenase